MVVKYLPTDKPIKNEKLLKEYTEQRCLCCESLKNVNAHHIARITLLRLDVEYNLQPLCFYCHALLHADKKNFIQRFGLCLYNLLTNYEPVLERYRNENS